MGLPLLWLGDVRRPWSSGDPFAPRPRDGQVSIDLPGPLFVSAPRPGLAARLLVALVLLTLAAIGSASAESAESLLRRSIAYHDPEGSWMEGPRSLEVAESRPDGTTRTTRVVIDTGRGRFGYESERDSRRIEAQVNGTQCFLRVDGAETAGEEAEKLGLSCARLQRIRNYYTYLWGLPMKLLDPGTLLDPEVRDGTFEERPVKTLRVTYDAEVGSDIWYFHLDPDTAALVGYRFYHDEAANDGEYIVLEGEVGAAGVRLPRRRTWYTHSEDELLGTDELVSIHRVD